jgi:outer membrane lipoprotein-sorting protein
MFNLAYMKKSIQILVFLLLSQHVLVAQQDPEAKKILDRVSAKNKQYISIQVNFVLSIENRREDQNSSTSGLIKIKGTKYYMESLGTKVYYNGKTMWSYTEDLNEVIISEPDTSSGDFVENPALIFDFYNRDFKYHLVGETKLDEGWMYEIDLFPKNLDQPYSRFKIFIKRDTDELYMVKAVGKDGIDYTAFLKDPKYNQVMNDDLFTFRPEKYKGIDIVDMRF